MGKIALMIAALALAGCGGERIKPAPIFTCPTLKSYSKSEQSSAASELKATATTNPTIARLVADYANLRAGIREACK